MHKKIYQKPVVTKVRLDVKSAVLGNCRNSGITVGKEPLSNDCRTPIVGCQT
mgnify:CR=1 FL=1